MNDIVLQISNVQLPSTLGECEELLDTVNRRYWVARCLIERHIKQEFFRSGDGAWRDYCMNRWNEQARHVDTRIAAFDFCCRVSEISETFQQNWPSNMSHATALKKIEDLQDAAAIYERVLANANGSRITAATITAEAERYRAEQAKNWITLGEWTEIDETEQQRILLQSYGGGKTFNNQTDDNIEWARWSWNPVTGCLHNCSYCYARDSANRFYPQLFEPSIVPDRLHAPAHTKQPDFEKIIDPVERMGRRNVFVCSMADLFGKWVPADWIEAVLQQAWDNPQWNFLFLTKFPIRMAEFEYPTNTWLGTTVDKQSAVERAEKAFNTIRANGYEGIAWLSCEPMMERLTFGSIELFDWVVMGGASKSTQTPEYKPPFDDIVHLYLQADAMNIPMYFKTNLGIDNRIREYPVQTNGATEVGTHCSVAR